MAVVRDLEIVAQEFGGPVRKVREVIPAEGIERSKSKGAEVLDESGFQILRRAL